MRMLISTFGLLALSLTASAATIFTTTPQADSPAGTSATVIIDQNYTGACSGCVQVTATFNDGPLTSGDITGVFLELAAGANLLTQLTSFSIGGGPAPTITTNTETAANNANINPVGNQVGGSFSYAFAIGNVGVGQGDVFPTVTFGLQATGLTEDSFGAAGVRVQSINPGGLSGKYFDGTPSDLPSDDPVVPEPSTYVMLGSSLAALAFWRRKRV